MTTCLVIGASGAVGRYLLPRLADEPHDTLALSRRARADPGGRLRWTTGTLDGGMPALPALDRIISLGPLDAFARWLADARFATPPRIVALGSTSVDSKRDSRDAGERALARQLDVAEQALQEACTRKGLEWTLLRPTLIYGAGVDRSLSPIARFATRWRVFPRLPSARGLRQPVHAEDLAEACLRAAASAAASGRIYAVGGGERLTFDAMLARVRASLRVATLPLPLPIAGLRLATRFARRAGVALGAAAIDRLQCDLVADNAAALRDFGWAPRLFHPSALDWEPSSAASPP